MDNRSFISNLSRATGLTAKDAARLTSALIDIVAEGLAENDNVALPGFGTFESEKVLEHIETDTKTGKVPCTPRK